MVFSERTTFAPDGAQSFAGAGDLGLIEWLFLGALGVHFLIWIPFVLVAGQSGPLLFWLVNIIAMMCIVISGMSFIQKGSTPNIIPGVVGVLLLTLNFVLDVFTQLGSLVLPEIDIFNTVARVLILGIGIAATILIAMKGNVKFAVAAALATFLQFFMFPLNILSLISGFNLQSPLAHPSTYPLLAWALYFALRESNTQVMKITRTLMVASFVYPIVLLGAFLVTSGGEYYVGQQIAAVFTGLSEQADEAGQKALDQSRVTQKSALTIRKECIAEGQYDSPFALIGIPDATLNTCVDKKTLENAAPSSESSVGSQKPIDIKIQLVEGTREPLQLSSNSAFVEAQLNINLPSQDIFNDRTTISVGCLFETDKDPVQGTVKIQGLVTDQQTNGVIISKEILDLVFPQSSFVMRCVPQTTESTIRGVEFTATVTDFVRVKTLDKVVAESRERARGDALRQIAATVGEGPLRTNDFIELDFDIRGGEQTYGAQNTYGKIISPEHPIQVAGVIRKVSGVEAKDVLLEMKLSHLAIDREFGCPLSVAEGSTLQYKLSLQELKLLNRDGFFNYKSCALKVEQPTDNKQTVIDATLTSAYHLQKKFRVEFINGGEGQP